MPRIIKFFLLVILIGCVIAYLDSRIATGNIVITNPKLGGLLIRLKSILILGSLFFIVMSRTKRLLFLFLGFFISLVSSVLTYLLLTKSNLLDLEFELAWHILSCLAFIIFFFLIDLLFGPEKDS